MLEPHDLEVIAILRRLPGGLSTKDRDTLTRYAHAYVGAFLRARRSRSRFGFQRPFSEVVQDVATWEVGHLLRPTGDGVMGERVPLELLLTRVVDLATATDDDVLYFFRRLLRTLGEHGLIAEWKRERPQEARLLKLFKCLLKGSTDPRLQRDLRGNLVVSAASRLDLPPVPTRELEELFGHLHLPIAVRFEELPSVLQPRDGYGGWCYLLDLVRIAARIHLEALGWDSRPNDSESADPGSGRTWRGVPLALWAERIRRSLAKLAAQYLEADARKAAGRGAVCAAAKGQVRSAPPKDRKGADLASPSSASKPEQAAYLQVCVEMICRGYNLGRPDWADLSQAELLRKLLSTKIDAEEKRHCTRMDYLIRRVRCVWEA
jgi:hypothetical protein